MKTIFKILLLVSFLTITTLQARNDRPVGLKINLGYLEYGDDTDSPLDLIITFKAVENAEYYNFYFKEVVMDEDNSFKKATKFNDNDVVLSLEESTDLGIDLNAKAYSYYVTAVDENGNESERSNIVSTACGRVYNEGDLEDVFDREYSSIISNPVLEAEVYREYNYDVEVLQDRALEQEFDIEFRLSSAPEGMTIDNKSGLIKWIPNETGSFVVKVESGVDGDFTRGNSQIFKLNVNSVTFVVFDNTNRISKVSPNPAYATAKFEWDESVNAKEISVYNISGQKALSVADFNSNFLNLNVQSLNSGKYFLSILDQKNKVLIIPFQVSK